MKIVHYLFCILLLFGCKKVADKNKSSVWMVYNDQSQRQPVFYPTGDKVFIEWLRSSTLAVDYGFGELKFRKALDYTPIWHPGQASAMHHAAMVAVPDGYILCRFKWAGLPNSHFLKLNKDLKVIDSLEFGGLQWPKVTKLMDGNFLFYLGRNSSLVPNKKTTFVKMNSDMKIIWSKTATTRDFHYGPVGDQINGVIELPDKSLFTYGKSWVSSDEAMYNGFVMNRSETGEPLDSVFYELGAQNEITDALLDDNKIVALFKNADSNNIFKINIKFLNYNGGQLRDFQYYEATNIKGFQLIQQPDGYLVFFKSISQYGLLKIDKKGVKQWVKYYGSGLLKGLDEVGQIIETADGNFIMGIEEPGFGNGKTGNDLAFIKVNRNGDLVE